MCGAVYGGEAACHNGFCKESYRIEAFPIVLYNDPQID